MQGFQMASLSQHAVLSSYNLILFAAPINLVIPQQMFNTRLALV
nr:MAG TPA: hypothetical protein [Caudoviricetes sp.]